MSDNKENKTPNASQQKIPANTVTALSWKPNGKQLAIGFQCGEIRIYAIAKIK